MDPVSLAREAARDWRGRPLSERLTFFKRLRLVLARDREQLAHELSQTAGMVPMEALLSELFPVLDLLKYYEREAPRILRPRTLGSSMNYPHTKAETRYRPYGVVLVVAPSNFPFQLSIVPALSAALAGNAVVVKVSELRPGVTPLLRACVEKAGFPPNLIQFLDGGAETVRGLIGAGPDKIFFTGGERAAREILKEAAERLIPADMELGGSDPMIVLDDADLERASRGAVYGSFCNSGQVCVSARRLFVQASVYDAFLSRVLKEVPTLRQGPGLESELPRLISPQSVDRLKSLVEEAVREGARLLTPWQWKDGFLAPLVLADVAPGMRMMKEEVFGPLMMLAPFRQDDEAIALANASPFGLNASVWSRNLKRAQAVAARLEAGSCAINDVLKNIGRPELPFGGVKKSGFGRYHGPEGLLAFSQTYAVVENSARSSSEVNWFPYSAERFRHLSNFMALRFGEGSFLGKMWRYRETLRYFREVMK